MNIKSIRIAFITSTFAALVPHVGRAALIIHETFNYPVGNISGQAATGTGLTGSWSSPTASATGATVFTSLSLSGHFATDGGALQIGSGGPNWGEGAIGAAVSATPSSTFFTSSLMQVTSPDGNYYNDWVVEQRFNTSAGGAYTTSTGRNLARVYGSGGTSTGKGGVSSNTSEVVQGTGTMQSGTTYLLVTKYTVSASDITSAQLFAFDAASYTSYLAAATPATADSLLSTYALYSLTDSDTAPLSGLGYLQFLINGGPIGTYDDFRLGTSIADVVNVVPEPGSAVLALLGCGLLHRSRTRTRKTA